MQAAYQPDRPLLVRSQITPAQEVKRAAEARRLITGSGNRSRAVQALGPLRRAASVFN